MKLKINGFENIFEFDDEHVNVLTINETKCFTHIIEMINEKNQGNENDEIFLLDNNDNEIKLDKAIIIFDLFNIDFNSKKILNKLYETIEKNVETSQDLEIENLIVNLRNKLIEEINELPFEFVMKSEIDISDILKVYSLKIDTNNYNTILERIEFFIDILSTLKISDLLIIPNLKTYLCDDELENLYKYVIYNNIKLLIIEKENKKLLKYEKEMLIDENYCDMIIKANYKTIK